MTESTAPRAARPKASRAPGQKRGYRGWSLQRVTSRSMIRCYVEAASRKYLKAYPEVLWWPVLDDWAGAQQMLDQLMNRQHDALHELTLQWPDHEFGFESRLEAYRAEGPIASRRLLRTKPLPRGFQLDVEHVVRQGGREQVVARLLRGSVLVKEEVLADSATAAFDADTTGTENASFLMTSPE